MSRRSPGLIFAAICVAALALRLLLPAGWMPVATGTGGLAITLCSGAVLPADPETPAPANDQSCAFAQALGPLLATAALVLLSLSVPLLAVLALPPVQQLPRRHRSRPLGQGPPHA